MVISVLPLLPIFSYANLSLEIPNLQILPSEGRTSDSLPNIKRARIGSHRLKWAGPHAFSTTKWENTYLGKVYLSGSLQ